MIGLQLPLIKNYRYLEFDLMFNFIIKLKIINKIYYIISCRFYFYYHYFNSYKRAHFPSSCVMELSDKDSKLQYLVVNYLNSDDEIIENEEH